MKDTSPEVNARMIEMIQKKTPVERLAMGCSTYDFSKQIVISGLLKENPKLSGAELKKELFLKFYGNNVEGNQKRKIIAYLTR